MTTGKMSLLFRIVKFFVNFNWYMALVISALTSILIIAVFFGFEPNALHVQIPLKLEYFEDDNYQNYKDEMRPMILNIEGDAQVLVEKENIPYLEMRMLMLLLALVIYNFGSYHLRQFIKIVSLGYPLAPEIPRRIRFIGLAIMIWGPFLGIFSYWQGWVTLRHLKNLPAAAALREDIHPEYIFIGLIFLVIAEIIKAGVKIRQEQELTI